MRKLLLLLISVVFVVATASAQQKISGKIIDSEDNEPLAYVSVSVKGTNVGAVSDTKGTYTITLPKGKNTIIFSFLGYKDLEIITTKSNTLNVKLEKSTLAIDEVVVTGFQNIKKQSFTGSSVKINAADMELAGTTDISRMLEGKVAGVFVQNVSSTFGAAPKVRIRGVTSISGENKPLWVVDGVVLEDVVEVSNDQLSSGDPSTLLGSSVAGINASDIETFDVLKDASATALYGARAMNGVVVITTKRGKQGAPRITFNTNLTMRSKPRYSQYNIMNSADQMSVYSEMERKGLLSSDIVNSSTSGVYGIMYNAINRYDATSGEFGLENTVEARRAFLYNYAKANTDWFNQLFTNDLMQEYSLSVSTGTEKSRTYASVGLLHDAGWTVADRVTRYTLNFRNDYDISKKISVSFQAVGSVRQQTAPGTYEREQDKVSGEWSREFDINPFSYSLNTSRAMRPYDNNGNLEYTTMNYAPFNIFNELENNKIDLNVADIKLQGEFNYNIVKGLKFNFTGAVRYVKTDQVHKITENSNVAGAYRADYNSTIRAKNPYLWKNQDDLAAEPISVMKLGGFYNTAGNTLLNYDVRNSLSYNKVWDGNRTHEFNALAGVQIKSSDRNITNATQAGYQYGMGGVVNNDPNYFRMMSDRQKVLYASDDYYDRFAAFYANVDYNFDRRYSVSATVRYDGSNALGDNSSSRWLPTWNFGAKWNIMNESFMKNVSQINTMSVRGSYGLTASMPSTTNASAIFRNQEIYRPGSSENGIEIESLANSELTWEKSYQFNIGYDLTMFDGRLNFAFDFFNRQSFDLISLIKVSGIGGQMWKYANYADLDSHGYDVTLGGTLIRNKDWHWSANATFGYSKNVIRNAKNAPSVNDLVRGEGGNKNDYPVNSLFSIPFAGLDSKTGIPTFRDEAGNVGYGIYTQGTETDFLKYEGQVDPKFTGGLNTTLRWKNLSMNVFFTYQMGNMIRLAPSFSSNYGDDRAMGKEFKDRWVMSGDEKNTNIPAIADKQMQSLMLGGVYPYVNYNYSDVRVAKGDFIRLKSVSINYELPESWLTKTRFFRTASIRLTGKDLWLLYSDKALNGQDPEFFNTGGVAMPTQTQVVLSINLGF